MDIPLNPDDIMVIDEAKSRLRMAYSRAYKALAALTEDGNVADPRIKLTGLKTDVQTLSCISNDVAARPYLTEEHREDIEALKETTGEALTDIYHDLTQASVEHMDGQSPMSTRSISALRHEAITYITVAARGLERLYEMVDKKTNSLARINTHGTSKGAPSQNFP